MGLSGLNGNDSKDLKNDNSSFWACKTSNKWLSDLVCLNILSLLSYLGLWEFSKTGIIPTFCINQGNLSTTEKKILVERK